MKRRDLALAGFFLLGWLVPLAHVAATGHGSSSIPRQLQDLYSVSCLFRHRIVKWRFFYVQVQTEGSRAWDTVPEDRLFPMRPFGYRSRFDRYMERFGARSERARDELAHWVGRRYGELNPDAAPVVAVRYLAATHDSSVDDPPSGHWHKPALETEQRKGLRLVSMHPVGTP